MARHLKNYCDYFPHDRDMRNHRKIKAIRTKFGIEGYAIWSMLLEYLTGIDGNEFENSSIEIELMAGDFGVSGETIRSVIDYCLTLELLFDKNGFIYSESLDDRLKPVYVKRGVSKENSKKQHRTNGKFASNNTVPDGISGAEIPHRRGKEIKGDKKLLADATKEEIKAAAKKIFLEHGLAEWFSEQQAQELSKKYLEKLPIRNLYEIIDAWLEKLDSLPITITINGTKHEPKKSNGSSFSYPTIKAIDVDKKNGRVKLLDGSFIDLNEGDKRALKNNILILDKFYKGMKYDGTN